MAQQQRVSPLQVAQLGLKAGQLSGAIPSTSSLLGLGGLFSSGTAGASSAAALGLGSSAVPGIAAAAGPLAGLSAAIPIAGLGLAAAAILGPKLFGKKPSVGPNFNLRYSGTGGSSVIARPDAPYGFDNGFDPNQAQSFSADYGSRLSNALGQTGGIAVNNGLEGTFGYNKDHGGYFSKINSDVRSYESLDDAFSGWATGQIGQGRISGVTEADLLAALGVSSGAPAQSQMAGSWGELSAKLRQPGAARVGGSRTTSAPRTVFDSIAPASPSAGPRLSASELAEMAGGY